MYIFHSRKKECIFLNYVIHRVLLWCYVLLEIFFHSFGNVAITYTAEGFKFWPILGTHSHCSVNVPHLLRHGRLLFNGQLRRPLTPYLLNWIEHIFIVLITIGIRHKFNNLDRPSLYRLILYNRNLSSTQQVNGQ